VGHDECPLGNVCRKFAVCGDNMNDTEAKIESKGNGAARLEWQPKPRVMVAGMEPAADLSLRSFRNEAEVHAINCALRQTGAHD